MIGQGTWTNIFGLAEPGDTSLIERVAVAAVKAGYAVVLDKPGQRAPMCTLTARQAKTEDTKAQTAARDAGDRLWQRRRHPCGLHHAFTDPAAVQRIIRRLAGQDVIPNIGLELGASRLVVVDVDTADEREGYIRDYQAEIGGFPVLTVRSPGAVRTDGEWVHKNGGHFWYTLPDGLELPAGAGVLKADSGWSAMWAKHQVLTPPSVRPEGPYVLLSQPEQAPAWLVDRIIKAVDARRVRAERSLELVLDSERPIERYQAVTPWADLLEVDGWTDTGLVDTCSCPIWTAPGTHASPKSATAHDVGCSRYDVSTGWGPLHVWTDNPPDFLAGAGNTFTKIQYLARRDHDGAHLPVLRELGLYDAGSRDDEFPGFAMGAGALDSGDLPPPAGAPEDADPFDGAEDPAAVAARVDAGGEAVAAPAEEAIDAVSALIAEMLSSDELDSIPDLEPLIDGMLDLDTLARVIGKSNHGKTFVCLDMAAAVATGQPWHGRGVRQGLVVFLVAEGARGFKKRLRAWERRHNGGAPIDKDRLLILPRPVQATDHKAWRVLVLALNRLHPALVFLDTQARVTVGVNENDNSEMGVFVERVEAIRRSTGACVCVVHHLGHNGDQGRGASAVVGAVSTEIRVVKTDEGKIELWNDKQKDEAQFEPIRMELETEGDSAVLVGGDPFDAAVEAQNREQAAEHARAAEWRDGHRLRDQMAWVLFTTFNHGEGATRAELRSAVAGHPVMGEGFSRPSLYRVWNELVEAGVLVQLRDGDDRLTQRFILSDAERERLEIVRRRADRGEE